jgi:hypothetical protein
VANALAGAYDATATYAVGDLCIYDGILYECTTAITTAEAWDATHWKTSNFGDAVSDLNRQLSDKQDAPSTAGTAGQVLGLDSNLDPVWLNQSGGGDAATEKLIASIIPGTTQTITFNANGKPYSIVHASNGTTARTDLFTWSDGSVTEVRTLSTGETLTIFTNLVTLAQTISAVTN